LEKVSTRSIKQATVINSFTDEREERMDNESERASLMSSNLPTNRRGVDSLRSRGKRSWFDRLFKRENAGPAYQPVANEE
jgi:hypothetical protein